MELLCFHCTTYVPACLSVTDYRECVKLALHLCKPLQSAKTRVSGWIWSEELTFLFLCVLSGRDCAQKYSHDRAYRMWQDRDCEAAGQISRCSLCQGNYPFHINDNYITIIILLIILTTRTAITTREAVLVVMVV